MSTTTTAPPEDDAAEQVVDAVAAAGSAGEPWLLVAGIVVGAIILERTITYVIRRWWNRKNAADALQPGQIARSKAHRTRLSIIRSLITYTIAGVAIAAIIAVLSDGSVPATLIVGALAITAGWSLNQVFSDMIAGTLLLFERQYRVGDYISIPGRGLAGVVEEFALRTTVLRSFNGDRITVLNGTIHEIVKIEAGYRDFEVEFFVPADRLDRVRSLVERVCARLSAYHQNLFLKGPVPVSALTLEGRRVSHIRIRAVVPPTLEWLAEETLPAQLRLELGDMIVGPVQVFNLDNQSFDQYLHDVILPRFQALESEATGEIPLVAPPGGTPAASRAPRD